MDVKNYERRLNPVWHRMLYSCIHTATVGIKGLTHGMHLPGWPASWSLAAYQRRIAVFRRRHLSRWFSTSSSSWRPFVLSVSCAM